MARPIALYDACVLYPAPLRDLLMQLSLTGLFKAKWTNHIHDEWIRNVLKHRPDLNREQLELTRRLMNAATQDSLVAGYESLIEGVKLPDPDDRHVLAAAIHAQADLLVTFNLKDFPAGALRPYGIKAQHPDDFVVTLFNTDSSVVCAAARMHRARLRHPAKTAVEYLHTLEAQGLPKTVRLLSQHAVLI